MVGAAASELQPPDDAEFDRQEGADTTGDEPADAWSRTVPASGDGEAGAQPASARPLAEAFMELFQVPSMSQARRAVRTGQVLVNGAKRKCDFRVSCGDRIEWRQRTEGAPALDRAAVPEELREAFRVLHEDDDLAVVWKPEGVDTAGGEGGAWSALRISHHFLRPTLARGAYRRARAVHRLDAPTAGLLCLAKTQPAHAGLSRAFEERRVRKQYVALLVGEPLEPPAGRVELPLRCLLPGRGGELQQAVTDYEVLRFDAAPSAFGGGLSTVALRPLTGRTHQLRRHAAQALGRPILGDERYGAGAGLPGASCVPDGLFLSAVELEVPRPDGSGPLLVRAEEPAKFEAARRAAREATAAACSGERGGGG